MFHDLAHHPALTQAQHRALPHVSNTDLSNLKAALLGKLKEMQGKETVGRWQAWALEGDLPHLFAELMALHYDPHYERSQARHFSAWPARETVVASDLSDAGIDAVAEAIRTLASR